MRELTVVVFLACAAMGVALWWGGRRRAFGLVSIADVVDRALAGRAARMTILLFWWWIGWHFLVARTVDPG